MQDALGTTAQSLLRGCGLSRRRRSSSSYAREPLRLHLSRFTHLQNTGSPRALRSFPSFRTVDTPLSVLSHVSPAPTVAGAESRSIGLTSASGDFTVCGILERGFIVSGNAPALYKRFMCRVCQVRPPISTRGRGGRRKLNKYPKISATTFVRMPIMKE